MTEYHEATVLATIDSYKKSADEYIKNTNQLSFFPGLQAWLDYFVELLPGKKVLDIAFGSGRDILHMLERGLDVEGIELTEEFIETLRRQVDVPLYKMDMRQLDFPASSFHGLWCCSSFLHLPHKDALPTLKDFARVLCHGGILYLSLKEGHGYEWRIAKESNRSNASRYFAYYTSQEIQELLLEAGFEMVSDGKQAGVRANRPLWINALARKHRDCPHATETE